MIESSKVLFCGTAQSEDDKDNAKKVKVHFQLFPSKHNFVFRLCPFWCECFNTRTSH